MHCTGFIRLTACVRSPPDGVMHSPGYFNGIKKQRFLRLTIQCMLNFKVQESANLKIRLVLRCANGVRTSLRSLVSLALKNTQF